MEQCGCAPVTMNPMVKELTDMWKKLSLMLNKAKGYCDTDSAVVETKRRGQYCMVGRIWMETVVAMVVV